MNDRIKTYGLPGGEILDDFQIYEVKGGEIDNKRYPHKTDRPHRHSYYEVCVFINDAGKHEIDFVTYSIRSNSVHFLSDRKSFVSGKSVSVRVDLGGGRIIKKKTKK